MKRRRQPEVEEPEVEEAPAPAAEQPADSEDRGLACSRCGCRHMYVIYTRPAILGRIQRRRECRNCGKRFTTYETSNP